MMRPITELPLAIARRIAFEIGAGQIIQKHLEIGLKQVFPALAQDVNIACLCAVSLSRQRYRLFGCTSAMSSPSKSHIALRSNQCRCNLHSLPGEINW